MPHARASGAFLGLLALAGIIALLAIAAPGEAANVDGCARLVHDSGSGDRAFLFTTDGGAVASTTCAESEYLIAMGECITWYGSIATSGSPPIAATRITANVFHLTNSTTHGATGKDNWVAVRAVTWTAAAFDGAALDLCATSTTTASGTPQIVTYRVALRACDTTGSGCATGVMTYDINSDDGGAPGTGNTVTDTTSGYYESGDEKDPLHLSADYDVETTEIVAVVTARWLNGTARQGLDSSIYIRIYDPDFSEYTGGPWTMTETTTPGVYRVRISIGSTPTAGVWAVTSDTVQPDNANENVTLGVTVTVTANRDALLNQILTRLSYNADLTNSSTASLALEATLLTQHATTRTQTVDAAAYSNTLINGTATPASVLAEHEKTRALTNTSATSLTTHVTERTAGTRGLINSTTSSLFTSATWTAWLNGAWEDQRGRLNQTAQQRLLLDVQNDTNGAMAAIYQETQDIQNNMTENIVARAWAAISPSSIDQVIVLGLGTAFTAQSAINPTYLPARIRGVTRGNLLITGLAFLAIYVVIVTGANLT